MATRAQQNGPVTRTLWGLITLLSVAVALVSARYLIGVGPFAPNVIENHFVAPWLIVHVGGAVIALLTGAFQFLAPLRRRWPVVHRWTGRAYAVGCLVGGVSGLMLALGTTMGPVALTGFAGLAFGWLVTTTFGWQHALQRRFVEHRQWMIRSWALTLAAVTLRLYLPIGAALGIDIAISYPAISWLCWVPNLIVTEIWLRRRPI